MLEKKPGKINEIIYEHTVYHGGKYKLYPTILYLDDLLNDLVKAEATSTYLRINPFYRNAKVNRQIEFDEFMFYLEGRESFTEEDEKATIVASLDMEEDLLQDLNWELGKVLYPLCRFDDPQKFGDSLRIYREYLNGALPQMFDAAKKELNLQEEDYAFGYFCFEVDSE